MKNRISIFSFFFFLFLFNTINGKYVVFALVSYIALFSYIEIKNRLFNINRLRFSILFLLIDIFLLRYILTDIVIEIKYKNLFSSFYIVLYNYIFCDLDFFNKLFVYTKNKIIIISKKWKLFIDNNKKFWFLSNNFCVFIFFLLSLYTIISFSFNGVDNYYDIYNQSNGDKIVELLKDKKINFDFVEGDKSFSNICFPFGTFRRRNNSNLTFYVKDKDNVIYKKKFNVKSLRDGKIKCFNIGKTSVSKLKQYNVYFSPDFKTKKGNSVALFADKKSGNISFRLSEKQSGNVFSAKRFLIAYSFIIFFVINYLINSKIISHEKFYIILVLFMLPILFIFPSLTIPDEYHHFYRSFSNSQIFDDNFKFNGFDNNFTIVPDNSQCLNYSNVQVTDKVRNLDDISNCSKNGKNVVFFNTAAGINPIFGYIPQSIGIKIADFLSDSPLFIFYFGRLFSFLCSLFIVYMAIEITPKYKSLFLFVASMMMFIQQMISYSYDSILNSISLLFMAYIIKILCSGSKITFKNLLFPLLLFSIIVNIKPVYFPLGIMIFFIPKEKFEKNKYLNILLFFIIFIGFMKLLSFVISLGTTNTAGGLINHNASRQLSYIIKHPLYMFYVAFNTLKYNSMFYIRGLVGYFGWFIFKVNDIYFLFYLLLFLYIIFSENNILDFKKRFVLFASILFCIVMIFGGMYLLWSSYKEKVVSGVQGRYFFPLIVPLALCFIPKKSLFKLDEKVLYSSIIVFLLQFILTLIVWYF